jgi:hypothetical protein
VYTRQCNRLTIRSSDNRRVRTARKRHNNRLSEDYDKNLISKNYDENLFSEDHAETLLSENYDENLFSGDYAKTPPVRTNPTRIPSDDGLPGGVQEHILPGDHNGCWRD